MVGELGLVKIQASQLESGSFDGQYFHLGVPNHLKELLNLPEQFLCTWDPLHKIGVTETHIRKDPTFKWLLDLTETCQKVYKKFNWGKNYQALVEMCEQLDMVMRNLKIFSTTRFPNSVRGVFDTLIDDFKPVVTCLEEIIENNTGSSVEETTRRDDAKAILRRIKSNSFVLGLSGTSDIYEHFGHIANLCQKGDILPHERYDSVMSGVDHFADMLSTVLHDKCLDTIMELKSSGKMEETSSVKCLWPRYHGCLEELKSNDNSKGVVIKAEHETKAFNTRLAKKNNDVALVTKADEIVKTNLVCLIQRLETDLRKDTFEKETVEVIELIRNVTDLKSLAVEVRDNGYIQTAHKFGIKFVESAKKITNTIRDMPDIELKESFCKFLKSLEIHTKDVDVKDMDSKLLIKDFLQLSKLYEGTELTLQCICTAAVKISVESVVESLVSRYENHFDASRQLKEDRALDEMEIAENGPEVVKADAVLSGAMNKYWAEKSPKDPSWHFCHKTQDVRTYAGESKVVKRLLSVESKLPFME